MKMLIGALAAALLASQATAATQTFKVSVTGSISEITFLDVTDEDGNFVPGGLEITDVSGFDGPSPDPTFFGFLSPAGSMTFEAESSPGPQPLSFEDCTGLLQTMCFGGVASGDLATSSFSAGDIVGFVTTLNPLLVKYEDDGFYDFSYFGTAYNAIGGVVLAADLDSYSIEVVPLPASGLLLMSLLPIGMVLTRTRKRAAKA